MKQNIEKHGVKLGTRYKTNIYFMYTPNFKLVCSPVLDEERIKIFSTLVYRNENILFLDIKFNKTFYTVPRIQ